mmetsp:Transcript_122122/g.390566  ORF Transcript_122122/g.390566 Transcript_122122/m.390566 type:complete len:232 (+) Transcript_122122:2-697(+)
MFLQERQPRRWYVQTNLLTCRRLLAARHLLHQVHVRTLPCRLARHPTALLPLGRGLVARGIPYEDAFPVPDDVCFSVPAGRRCVVGLPHEDALLAVAEAVERLAAGGHPAAVLPLARRDARRCGRIVVRGLHTDLLPGFRSPNALTTFALCVAATKALTAAARGCPDALLPPTSAVVGAVTTVVVKHVQAAKALAAAQGNQDALLPPTVAMVATAEAVAVATILDVRHVQS